MNTKKIILPQEQKQICIDALNAYKYSLEAQLTQGTEEDEDIKRTVFDIYGLIGILDTKYNLILEINKDDMDTFVSRHDVDFPNYVPLVEYKEAIPSFIENMDWELLRLQKDAILNSDLVSTEIDGLVHLIDAIQDLSVDTYGIDGKLVFPTISENEFDQFQLSKENTSKAKLADAITVIEAHGYSVEREYADVYIIKMDGNQCSEGTLDKNEVIEVAETMQQHSQATKLGTDVVAGLMTALDNLSKSPKFKQSYISKLNDAYDYIQTKYFGNEPDGDEQLRCRVNGANMLTDVQAVNLLTNLMRDIDEDMTDLI